MIIHDLLYYLLLIANESIKSCFFFNLCMLAAGFLCSSFSLIKSRLT